MSLSSVGPAERPLGFGQGRLFETGSVTIDELQNLVIGDIGGVCFPRMGLTRFEEKKLRSVNDRWTGLRHENLSSCAQEARRQDQMTGIPGVVVVSIGKARAKFIHELITFGVINHLIIDDELEEELLHNIEESSIAGVDTRAMAGNRARTAK